MENERDRYCSDGGMREESRRKGRFRYSNEVKEWERKV
jgi:hypothetical protein